MQTTWDPTTGPIQVVRCLSLMLRCAIILLLACSAVLGLGLLASAQVSVTTYHMDNLRTGLNANETRLSQIIHVDRKSTRLNSSHVSSSYAVFCLKKKN